MKETYIEVPFEMYYDIKNGISLEEAIEQLKSLSRIISKQSSVVSSIANVDIARTEIFVNELIEGSWKEKLCIKLFFKSEAEYEKFKTACGDIEMNDWAKTILAMGLGAFVMYSIAQMTPQPAASPSVHIEIKDNSGIVSLGKSIDLSDEQISKILEKNSNPSKADKQATLGVIGPARDGQATKVQIAGFEELTIHEDSFKTLPNEIPSQEGKERESIHSNMDIYIYASDRDKSSSGWAGIVPELFEQRVKFELSEGVDPNTIHGHRKVKADVVVHERFNVSQKAYKPFKVVITKTT